MIVSALHDHSLKMQMCLCYFPSSKSSMASHFWENRFLKLRLHCLAQLTSCQPSTPTFSPSSGQNNHQLFSKYSKLYHLSDIINIALSWIPLSQKFQTVSGTLVPLNIKINWKGWGGKNQCRNKMFPKIEWQLHAVTNFLYEVF